MPAADGPMYEPFASAFAAHARVSAYNALYDRPAVLDVLGDVRGRHVLDVGCGPGLYAAALLARGATVTGVDASPAMIELARQEVGPRADLRVADIERPLAWLADGSVDLAVMALVLHHLDGRVAALAEVRRVLRPGGALVVSTVHPTSDWLRRGGSYFDVEQVRETWQEDWHVRYWRRPLQDWCDEFAEAGFLLERLVEPRPSADLAERYPDVAAQLAVTPGFVAFRLVKR